MIMNQCLISDLLFKSRPALIIQTLLKNNITARFFHAQLTDTDWTLADVSNFLSKRTEDMWPPGSAVTWREVFNETDQAIMSISRFMEVRVTDHNQSAH